MSDPGPARTRDIRPRSAAARALKNRLFVAVCVLATSLSALMLVLLLAAIVVQGWEHLDVDLLTSYPSRKPAEAGLKAALWGSIWLCAVCAAVAIPLGVGTAIFLEEYKPRRQWLQRLHAFVQLNISNLAGVPSIVYGILGLTVFVRMFGAFGSPNFSLYDEMLVVRLESGQTIQGFLIEEQDNAIVLDSPVRGEITIPLAEIDGRDRVYAKQHRFSLDDGRAFAGPLVAAEDGSITIETPVGEEVSFPAAAVTSYTTRNAIEFGDEESFWYFKLPLGSSVLAGGLTLALVILPVVIIASREALRAVPPSLREGAFALGSTRWQVIWKMVLPAAVPGIMTGSILSISRAIGEAAPLLVIGGFLFIMFTPRNLMDDFAAMPLQIFNWASRPQAEFHKVAASGILVLLVVLLVFNAAAILIRQRFQRPLQ